MKTNTRSVIYLLIIVALILASAFVWYRFFTSEPVSPVSSVSGGQGGDVGSPGLLQILGTLEGLKFDLGVLDSPLYKSLQDFTPVISVPETKGRTNPFVPL